MQSKQLDKWSLEWSPNTKNVYLQLIFSQINQPAVCLSVYMRVSSKTQRARVMKFRIVVGQNYRNIYKSMCLWISACKEIIRLLSSFRIVLVLTGFVSATFTSAVTDLVGINVSVQVCILTRFFYIFIQWLTMAFTLKLLTCFEFFEISQPKACLLLCVWTR